MASLAIEVRHHIHAPFVTNGRWFFALVTKRYFGAVAVLAAPFARAWES